MSQQPRQPRSAHGYSAFRSAFGRAINPNMAPSATGQIDVDLTGDSDHEIIPRRRPIIPRRPTLVNNEEVVDLTLGDSESGDEPQQQPKINAPNNSSPHSAKTSTSKLTSRPAPSAQAAVSNAVSPVTPSRVKPSTNLPQTRRSNASPVQSASPNGSARSGLRNSSGSKTKTSPQSAKKTQKTTPQDRPWRAPLRLDTSSSEEEIDNEIDDEISEEVEEDVEEDIEEEIDEVEEQVEEEADGEIDEEIDDEIEEESDKETDEEINERITKKKTWATTKTPPRASSRPRRRRRRNSQVSMDHSIGSSSPLLTRLNEQSSRVSNNNSKPAPRNPSPQVDMWQRALLGDEHTEEERLSISKLEESLQAFDQGMQDDHAATVRWLLHDAQSAVQERKLLFMDNKSPFAEMGSVQLTAGDALPEGCIKVKMESYTAKKKGKPIQLITKRATDYAPRVPKYSSHTTVQRNILSGDQEKLAYIPFFKDAENNKKKGNWNRLIADLEQAYESKDSASGRDSERLSQIRFYLDDWLEELNVGLDCEKLRHYILLKDDDDLGLKEREVKALRDSSNISLSDEVVESCRKFSEAFEHVFDYPVKDVIFPEERLREMVELTKKLEKSASTTNTPAKERNGDSHPAEQNPVRIGTFTDLTCLICGALSCYTHGDFSEIKVTNSDDSDCSGSEEAPEYQYMHNRLVMLYNDTLRKQDIRVAKTTGDVELQGLTERSCSNDCYRRADQSEYSLYQLTEDDRAKIRDMTISFRDKKQPPCTIAFLLDLPCWQVASEITLTDRRSVQIASPGRIKRPDWYDNKKKSLRDYWQDMTNAHLHQERCQPNACAHEGPCQSNCPCAVANILCESFCGCADDCPRKWKGCTCHSIGTACTSEACLCIQMNRECGPECASCGAVPRINPLNRLNDDLYVTGCQNIVLQRGVNRKMIMGESQLEGVGFGLYLGEPVKKGEYLGEYAGEIISFNEAERRGIIYDRKFSSFLFDLNKEWTIDAARLGNKTRFINHADNEKDGLNCEAKITLVNGEHRIKFIALRDIKAGEELLFNYGKKFAEKHGLNKKLPKAKEGNKKGVVVGEEALEALDGLNPANRVTRGRMTAIRGGHAGGRGRRGRKSAPLRIVEVEPVVDDDEEFETPLEDDDDDDLVSGRVKRKITRPLRYTR